MRVTLLAMRTGIGGTLVGRRRGRLWIAGLVWSAWFSGVGWAQAPSLPQAAIDGVIAAGARVELIKGGFEGLEGPVATPDGGLYFTDIPANRIYRLDNKGNITVWRENTQGANGLFLSNDGRLLAAEMGGKRVVALMPDGRATVLATAFEGKPLRAPNDLIPDKTGGIYFTDPDLASLFSNAPQPGHVHYLRPNGELLLLDDRMTFPNGITLSLDEKTLYVGDAFGHYGICLRRAAGPPRAKQASVRAASRPGAISARSAESGGRHGPGFEGPAVRHHRFRRAGDCPTR